MKIAQDTQVAAHGLSRLYSGILMCINPHMNAITVRETGGQGFEGHWEGFMGELGGGKEGRNVVIN